MKPVVVIMHGVSGTGKSYIAKSLQFYSANSVIVSADEYFQQARVYYPDGAHETNQYIWKSNLLQNAHNWCRAQFKQAILDLKACIIVDNTNLAVADYEFYEEQAIANGYRVQHICIKVDKHEDWPDAHNVLAATKQRQYNRLIGVVGRIFKSAFE